MTKRVSRTRLRDAFLRDLRRLVLSARGKFFTREKPVEPSVLVDASVEDAERLLGERHFAPNWDLSFAYFGEVVNLRRVEYVPHHRTEPAYRWWQVHVRGYHHPNGIELTAHFETDPSESPDAHVDRVGIDVPRGMGELRDVLDDASVDYESLSATESAALGG